MKNDLVYIEYNLFSSYQPFTLCMKWFPSNISFAVQDILGPVITLVFIHFKRNCWGLSIHSHTVSFQYVYLFISVQVWMDVKWLPIKQTGSPQLNLRSNGCYWYSKKNLWLKEIGHSICLVITIIVLLNIVTTFQAH